MNSKRKVKALPPAVRIKKDRCKGCGLCIFYCPAKCLEFSSELNRKGVEFVEVKKEVCCTGCGFCFLICPDNCFGIRQKSIVRSPMSEEGQEKFRRKAEGKW